MPIWKRKDYKLSAADDDDDDDDNKI